MTEGEPWFVEAFRSEYVDVYAHRDLRASRHEAQYLHAQSFEEPVLDLCCGFGRHTLALRELGLDVVGLDLSADLLRLARTLPSAERIRGRLVRGDARDIPLGDACCGAVVVLFSSFGYFGDAGDRSVLHEVQRVLRPGGRVILDLMNPGRVRATLVPHSRTQRPDWLLEERRELTEHGRRVVKRVTLTRPSGEVRSWREDVRLYSAEEIETLLVQAGMPLTRIDGDFDGQPAHAQSPRQIVHARKPPA